MTDNERMERAKRIKRMREGRRGDDGDEEATEDEPTVEDSADAPDDSADQSTESAGDGSPADQSTASASAEQRAAEANGGTAAATETTEEDPQVQETATTTTDASDQTVDDSTAETQDTAGQAAEDDATEAADTVDSTSGSRAEIPDAETMEAALEESAEGGEGVSEDDTAAPAAGIAGEAVESTQEADTRVLEFTLGDEQYGLDIQYIEEIVRHDNITRVPNTPEFVEGVVDLRGQITTILNPKVTIGKDETMRGDLIVVFDSEAFDDQHIGWVVDDVRQVSPVHDDEVNDPPMDEEYINGVIDRDEDDQFVIWTTPDLALEEAG